MGAGQCSVEQCCFGRVGAELFGLRLRDRELGQDTLLQMSDLSLAHLKPTLRTSRSSRCAAVLSFGTP